MIVGFNNHLGNGGKTATAFKPNGTSAKDKDNVEILASVGSPPPPTRHKCFPKKLNTNYSITIFFF